jgi:putative membrane-bound dehydrogenase-like protein
MTRLLLVPALAALSVLTLCCPGGSAAEGVYAVGAARVDITPSYPVRLSGFGFRRSEHEGVTQRIWAKALAVDDGEPAVLITVDNLGIPTAMVDEVSQRLAKRAELAPNRLAIAASHTHTAPMLRGVAPTLFGQPIPPEHQKHIDRYTRELTDRLEEVAVAALADRRPARLSWGIGKVGFAANRRTPGGPVDHDLPVLVVRDLKGKVRAIYVGYACHCVTLSNNRVSGDWAGYAQELLQQEFPGALALVSIGCGADSNPSSGVTGDRVELATRQGGEIAREVKRMLSGYLAPVTGKMRASAVTVDLPLAPLPSQQEWEKKAQQKDAAGYHAQVQLERLGRKEPLRTEVVYRIQCWAFGSSLAMVFLPGEVVVDYSLRLKRELDRMRLWVTAYANDAPCYIPSERVLKEGGYEGGGAMIYYDLPGPFAPGMEKKIIDAVHEQLDARFRSPIDPRRTGGSLPLPPHQSQRTLHTHPELQVDLVAAEPLVASPVAIDWGPDGRLWVAEMYDYPSGREGKLEPGGRIRVLEDSDGDGIYDRSRVFLDNIPFPTGVRVWRKGVLICAAPDILYAEDTKGDGKANVVRKLFSGFGTDNYQARVNSLEYGLDGWVHGSCGLFGGVIRSRDAKGRVVPLGDRDFRIRPDQGILEPAAGRTQQGRVRDDWGSWFGCDNSTLCRHYPLADHYLRRNPHTAPPDNAVLVPREADPNRLFPIGKLQLFKLSGPPGRTTAACGLGIYRDSLLGREYTGNAFVCEPVNLLVHRLCLKPQGSSFAGQRADSEKTSEFLAGEDGWFRPVQVRTGPDGALWIVDMYRHVIEHPRWIPAEDLARIDVRAGDRLGRIYRVRPREGGVRPFPRLDRLDAAGLVAALDSPNGWQRDLAGQMLLWRNERSAAAALAALAVTSTRPEARLHALYVLDGLGLLEPETILVGLKDEHPGVRRHAIHLAEGHLQACARLGPALCERAADPDPQVRLQLACSLGEWHDPRAADALARLALGKDADAYLLAAVLSSVNAGNVSDMVAAVFAHAGPAGPPEGLAQQVLHLAAALGGRKSLSVTLLRVSRTQGAPASWQLTALAGVLDALHRQGKTLDESVDAAAREGAVRLLQSARRRARDDRAPVEERVRAIAALGHMADQQAEDVAVLGEVLGPRSSAGLQSAAITGLGRLSSSSAAELLVERWKGCSPALQGQLLDALLSRPAWQGRLVEAIEKKEISTAAVDAARRQRLLRSADRALRERAARLFAQDTQSDRARVIEKYRDVLELMGDRRRGQAVFARRCAVCHRQEGVGHAVGPDLTTLSNKTPLYLLSEILDPNRNVDSRYVEYVAVTRDGRTLTGVLAGETAASITLRGQEGKEQVLLRADLEELASTGKSLMPEGLERDVSRQELADLLAYLTSTAANPAPGPRRLRPPP